MQGLFDRRILLVTGKGGVGKTTLAAALASVAASLGKRVLALDMEQDLEAPSYLSKFLGGDLHLRKDEAIAVSPSLSVGRLTPSGGHQTFLYDHLPYLVAMGASRSKYLQRFLMAAPGFQELGLVYRLLPYLREKRKDGSWTYDLLLVDLPATGHALALTSLPKPFLQIFRGGPIATAIQEAQRYFYDPAQTGAVVVTLPEPLPISETFELIAGLQRDRVPLAALLLNRLPDDPFLAPETEALQGFFQTHPRRLLGEWSFRRILRSKEARRRLEKAVEDQALQAPILRLPERPDDDPIACMKSLRHDLEQALQKAYPTRV